MSKLKISNTETNFRTQYPNGYFLRVEGKAAANTIILEPSRCNLQRLRVYPKFENSGWLHIYDLPTDHMTASLVSGKTPNYAPILMTSTRVYEWNPPLDVNIMGQGDDINLYLGEPFDQGVFLVLSAAEFTTSASEVGTMVADARIFVGCGNTIR